MPEQIGKGGLLGRRVLVLVPVRSCRSTGLEAHELSTTNGERCAVVVAAVVLPPLLLLLPAEGTTNPVIMALGLVFGLLGLTSGGGVEGPGVGSTDDVGAGGAAASAAGGGIRGNGRTELQTVISFKANSDDVPATSG